MSKRPSYQLTKHPIGSIREAWCLSWPLMLSFMSSSLMSFVDRLFLARYSIDALNAFAVAGMVGFLSLIIPMVICEMTEVFVGRFHGEGAFDKVGKPVWIMAFFALISWPFTCLFAKLLSSLLFAPASHEALFLSAWIAFVSPGMLLSITFMGFFIAIGKTRTVTLCTLFANIGNALLAPLCIFGTPYTPSLGIEGAALATGIAQLMQALFLMAIFLGKDIQAVYTTKFQGLSKKLFFEMCRIGLPTSLGRIVECASHSLYFQIMTLAGKEALTCATITQSFFILILFCIDGIGKSSMAIMSNLVGAKCFEFIPRVLRSCISLHGLIFILVVVFSLFGIDFFLPFMLNSDEAILLSNSDFLLSLRLASFGLSLFYLFDGIAWILAGFLLSVNESKFIFYAGVVTSIATYLLPLYFLVTQYNAGGATGWAIIAMNSLCLLVMFALKSRKLLRKPKMLLITT
jgi:MATE family multidrug resistance protein